MDIKVVGKGIDLGVSLTEFTTKEISDCVDKYLDSIAEGFAAISKDNKLFCVEIVLRIGKGFILKTNGSSDDPYRAVSIAIERLEEKIKKHKNRIKNKERRGAWETGGFEATNYTLERKESGSNDEEHLVIAEQEKFIMSLSVSEAVMKLDLGDLPVVMFKNADSGRINVIYKRPDGHIGWIDYKG